MNLVAEIRPWPLMLLLALAPLALAISHPLVSYVFVPLALLAAACSGRARAGLGALAMPMPIAAGLIGLLGAASAIWAPDAAVAASKSAIFLLVVFAGAWLAGTVSDLAAAEAERLAVVIRWASLAAIVLLGIQVFGSFLIADVMTGDGNDPRIAAIKMNVSSAGLIILVWAALALQLRRLQAGRTRFVAAAVALLAVAAIVLAGRGLAPKLALLLGVLAGGAARFRPRATAVALGLGVVAASLALLVVPTRLYESEGFVGLRGLDASAKYRVDIWDNAAQWIRLEPLVGYGAGASPYMPPREELSKITGKPRSIPLYPHNVLVQTMLELGITGLLCFWAFFAALLRAAVRLSAAIRPHAFAAIASAISIWMIGYPLWRSAWVAWLGFCLLAFVIAGRASADRGGTPA